MALDLNSEQYWSDRFLTDWDEKAGPAQTRFFYNLALGNLPVWLSRTLQAERLSICDWGCATGEGTEILAHTFGGQVTGIDFARPAIEKARSLHKIPRFIDVDLLTQTIEDRFDVLFCSNTLEHFEDPWSTLETVSAYAKDILVILVPFQERERHCEHKVTFDLNMIPTSVAGRFHCVEARVIDASQEKPSYWPGDQILLVYASNDVAQRYALKLCDVLAAPGKASVLAIESTINALRRDIRDQQRAVQSLTGTAEQAAENDALKAEVAALHEALSVRETQIHSIHSSHSWRATAPLRSVTNGVRDIRQAGKLSLRTVYRALPLSPPIKHKLKSAILRHRRAFPGVPVKSSRPVSVGFRPSKEISPKADVFVWAIIDWHFRVQRPQHLARAFANRGHRTFYFSNHFIDAAEPGFRIEPLSEDGSLQIVYLHVPGAPAIYFGMPSPKTKAAVFASLGMFLEWAAPREILSLVQHPFWRPFADQVPNRKLVYDLMDHHEGFGDNAKDAIAEEHALLREADHVIVTSTFLEDIANKSNANVSMVRNAGDYTHFANRPSEIYRDEKDRRIIGYYGAIAEWFDIDLIEKIARARPDDCVLLIGADTVKAKERLSALPNVVMTGEVKYTDLPYYLYAFDVCILPFKVIPLTLATNPVKVYEYLSAGKPVISIDLPEISQFGDCVERAKSHADFLEKVDDVLSAIPGTEDEARRRQFAAEQTWDHRVEAFLTALEKTRSPRASVIVVTYNNLEFTEVCLESLSQDTAYDDFEIIVVDNASTDGSADYLKLWEQGGPNRTLILNEDNRGFAAANNQGLARATGDYFVLLNNDTYVTPGWLGSLVAHLRRNPDLGLVGPVTNNIGNEARIEIHYADMNEMRTEALHYTAQRIGRLHDCPNLAFFCVAFSRKTFEAVGNLDEAFRVGFFEDDDYCRRVQALGLRNAIADDVFIHHHLSASFDALKAEKKMELFEQNKLIYEQKWGPWTPHKYRFDKR
ncbi:glycosyltransferase [Aureimonas fodinaquatilis]|uniref:Glycosyltransferase n=1 Tax=Aureimonas fodinaquatilis TaxID=2565783 RepID=A0A5B0DXV5_9HYPH|nr:glycosyltransferase [Aureimonas fodinaquatilis]KAA0970390.1 glycosyltransferase [Aureimonas fodinaquatilis]